MKPEVNVLGLGVAVLGALAAGVSVFLPLVDAPGILPVADNSLAQADAGAAIAVGGLALIVLAAAYDYSRSGWTGIRSLVAGGLLVLGAFLLGSNDSYFELTTYGNEFLPDSVDGKPGIALYVTGAGGILALAGGYTMRESRAVLDGTADIVAAADDDAPAQAGGWEPDPRDPENTERWREGDRWTGAIRPRR